MALLLCMWLFAAPCLVAASPLPLDLTLLSEDTKADADRASYRLPQNVIPSSYEIRLAPHFTDDPFTFDGTVKITGTPVFTNSESISQLVLHAHKDIIVDSATVTYNGGNVEPSLPTETVGDNEFYIITLTDPLTPPEEGAAVPEDSLVISLVYTGILNDEMRGLYRSWYNESGVITWLATTHMEPTAARRAFPSFDEPGLRATFKVEVVAPPDYTALSNTAAEGDPVPEGDDGSRLYSFAATPPMSSYLFAVLVSQFDPTVSENDTTHNVWSRPSAAEQRKYAASLSPAILKGMEDFTGVPYNTSGLTKMDQLAIPDFTAGAMENWGLVIYRERRILVDEDETSTSYRKSVAIVISHEYSHQWFGDLVGPAWWNVLWLNEGFATYFEYFNTHTVETTWRLDEQFVLDEMQLGLSSDCRLSARPMTPLEDEVLTQAQISNQFDNIAYAKAGSVLRMIEHILGNDVWKAGLNKYLTTKSFQAAVQEDLINALTEAAAENGLSFGEYTLPDILHSWTDRAGHPVLTVTRNREDNTATVTQSRFLLLETTDVAPEWYVPLTWATTVEALDNTLPQAWLAGAGNVTIPDVPGDGWLLLNNKRTGFYRVLYEPDAWAELSAALQAAPDSLPALTQAQLIDDAFWLARAGKLEYSVALDLTLHLPSVEDYVPWTAALGVLSYVEDRLYNGPHFDNFKAYLLASLKPLYDKFSSFEVAESLSHVDKLLMEKVLTLVCELGESTCYEKAVELFAEITGDGTSSIAADVRSVVYCNAVRHGTAADWDRLWQHYLNTNVASEKTLVLAALGCSTDTDVLENYLHKTSDDSRDIRSQDYSAVYSAVYNNPAGYQAAANYITNGTASGASTILTGLAGKVTAQEDIDKLLELARQAGLSDAAVESVQKAAEEHVQWNEKYSDAVGEWLAQHVDSDSGASVVGVAAALLLTSLAAVWAA